jgi:hypothetical protein
METNEMAESYDSSLSPESILLFGALAKSMKLSLNHVELSRMSARITPDEIRKLLTNRSQQIGSCRVLVSRSRKTGRARPRKARGLLNIQGDRRTAPIWAWFAYYGVFPSKLVCHTCDNPPCIQKSHLFEGTISDNAKDAVRKGRWAKSRNFIENNPNQKMDRSIRNRIRIAKGTQTAIALQYGVSQGYVSLLQRGLR